MTHSPACTKLVAQFEGCRLQSYQDQNGIWTIGYGHTEGVTPGVFWSSAQAMTALDSDLHVADAAVNKYVKRPATQNQFDAMVSLCYNIGSGNFEHSSVVRFFNEGNLSEAADDFLLWNKADGKVDPGLVTRRTIERQLFNEAS